jgi:hypothetical protein
VTLLRNDIALELLKVVEELASRGKEALASTNASLDITSSEVSLQCLYQWCKVRLYRRPDNV